MTLTPWADKAAVVSGQHLPGIQAKKLRVFIQQGLPPEMDQPGYRDQSLIEL